MKDWAEPLSPNEEAALRDLAKSPGQPMIPRFASLVECHLARIGDDVRFDDHGRVTLTADGAQVLAESRRKAELSEMRQQIEELTKREAISRARADLHYRFMDGVSDCLDMCEVAQHVARWRRECEKRREEGWVK